MNKEDENFYAAKSFYRNEVVKNYNKEERHQQSGRENNKQQKI